MQVACELRESNAKHHRSHNDCVLWNTSKVSSRLDSPSLIILNSFHGSQSTGTSGFSFQVSPERHYGIHNWQKPKYSTARGKERQVYSLKRCWWCNWWWTLGGFRAVREHPGRPCLIFLQQCFSTPTQPAVMAKFPPFQFHKLTA